MPIENSVLRDHCLASFGRASWCQTVNLGTEFSIRTSHPCKILIFLHTRQGFPQVSPVLADISYLTYLYPTRGIDKQVAQRATIAHLSPMCQGQISFQKTYKWVMETRGPKSNSSELLCLSWLPATLMTIWSKMNELACRHHFPIISLWEIF